MTHAQAFMEWFGLTRAAAALLERLYAAGGETVSRQALIAELGIKGNGLFNRAYLIHEALPPGSLICVTRAGYRLSGLGLSACREALADDLAEAA